MTAHTEKLCLVPRDGDLAEQRSDSLFPSSLAWDIRRIHTISGSIINSSGICKSANTYSDSFDSSSRDLLTVIQLNSLQVVAVLQVFQSHISDEKTVIKLQDLQPLVTTRTVAQMKNPIIGDQFTVR